jgi:hypothetical protein
MGQNSLVGDYISNEIHERITYARVCIITGWSYEYVKSLGINILYDIISTRDAIKEIEGI